MRTSLSISVRRHFVDAFFMSHSDRYHPGAAVIDIGGKKAKRRGTFDLSTYPCATTSVNIDASVMPDIVADAASLPLPDGTFDIALAGELLEHVPNPVAVLAETYRVLKPGGVLLATVPFLFPVHGDPDDFARFTPSTLRHMLTATGFAAIEITPQGSWYAVFASMLQAYFRFPRRSRIGRWCGKLCTPLIAYLIRHDCPARDPESAWTTGYGIICVR